MVCYRVSLGNSSEMTPVPIHDAMFPTARIHGSSNKRIETGLGLLTLIPKWPTCRMVHPISTTLSLLLDGRSCFLDRVRGRSWHTSTRKHSKDPIKLRLLLLTGPVGLLTSVG